MVLENKNILHLCCVCFKIMVKYKCFQRWKSFLKRKSVSGHFQLYVGRCVFCENKPVLLYSGSSLCSWRTAFLIGFYIL